MTSQHVFEMQNIVEKAELRSKCYAKISTFAISCFLPTTLTFESKIGHGNSRPWSVRQEALNLEKERPREI